MTDHSMCNITNQIIDQENSSTAEERLEGHDDDATSVAESSLFHSCMSTASAIAKIIIDDSDHDDNVVVVHDEASALDDNAINPHTLSLLSHSCTTHAKHNISTTFDNVNGDITRKPPSDSSWSIPSTGELRPIVHSMTFNRDRTHLIISTSIGVRIRTLKSLSLPIQNTTINDNEMNNAMDDRRSSKWSWVHDVSLPPDGATYAQLLHSASLLAVIKPSSPRCCHLYNPRNASSPLAVVSLSAAVKRVELQCNVLVTMTVDLRLHVFHFTHDGIPYGQSMGNVSNIIESRTLQPVLITTINVMHPSDSPRGITRGLEGFNAGSYFDLSPNKEEPYLICKSHNGSPGTIRVYDPTKIVSLSSDTSTKVKRRIHFITTINAHDHSVTRMLIGVSDTGPQTSFLATTSAHGTRIRVFSLPSGENIWQWHRGKTACQFFSLSWNGSADRLAAYGSSGTIHIFEWQKMKRPLVTIEEDADDERRGFEELNGTRTGRLCPILDNKLPKEEKSTPILHRIASSFKRHASVSDSSTQQKNRSIMKLKHKPSSAVNAHTAKTQTLVLAMLNGNHCGHIINTDPAVMEDTLVLCSLNGELRRYSVDKSVELTQVEDVLASD